MIDAVEVMVPPMYEADYGAAMTSSLGMSVVPDDNAVGRCRNAGRNGRPARMSARPTNEGPGA